jgi:hypothetical protein
VRARDLGNAFVEWIELIIDPVSKTSKILLLFRRILPTLGAFMKDISRHPAI